MMIVHEKETNVKEICYSNLEDMPFPMVKFKAIADYFCSEDSIVVLSRKIKRSKHLRLFNMMSAKPVSLLYRIRSMNLQTVEKKSLLCALLNGTEIKP